MKYLLVPMRETTAHAPSVDSDVMTVAAFINLVTGIILSIALTSNFLPDFHGFGRFAVCAIFSIVFTMLSFFPVIGKIICIGCGIAWCIVFWKLFGGIGIVWLRRVLRAIALLFIITAEGCGALA